MGMSVGKKGFVSEINVTPFVDVMLVLLIIFMVTAPMMDQGLDVDLPETKQVDALPSDSEHLTLTVSKDGAIMLEGYTVPLEELESRLEAMILGEEPSLSQVRTKLMLVTRDSQTGFRIRWSSDQDDLIGTDGWSMGRQQRKRGRL